MQQYHDYLNRILNTGTWQNNRTGIPCIFVPGEMMQFNLQDGFPAVTTKKLAFKMVVAELIGFMRGYTNAADFRALGCNIWDANANENQAWLNNPNRKGMDDLGRIYGAQWRDFNGVDQLLNVIRTLLVDPTNRRIIMSAWNPADFDKMALPPCHVSYQFIANTAKNTLNLCMYQRSCDSFLGVPFNIASSALLLSIVARLTGFNVGTFTHFLADAHIYENHLSQVEELLTREPRPLPQLGMADSVSDLTLFKNSTMLNDVIFNTIDSICPEDFYLVGYDPHPAIKADMAV
jgi:thymidylate synthase